MDYGISLFDDSSELCDKASRPRSLLGRHAGRNTLRIEIGPPPRTGVHNTLLHLLSQK